MNNAMPAFAVFHFRTFMGYVSAVSHKQAVTRAKGRFPGKRLEVELAGNVPATERDRVSANRSYEAKRSV